MTKSVRRLCCSTTIGHRVTYVYSEINLDYPLTYSNFLGLFSVGRICSCGLIQIRVWWMMSLGEHYSWSGIKKPPRRYFKHHTSILLVRLRRTLYPLGGILAAGLDSVSLPSTSLKSPIVSTGLGYPRFKEQQVKSTCWKWITFKIFGSFNSTVDRTLRSTYRWSSFFSDCTVKFPSTVFCFWSYIP